jgi:hypothetical protein
MKKNHYKLIIMPLLSIIFVMGLSLALLQPEISSAATATPPATLQNAAGFLGEAAGAQGAGYAAPKSPSIIIGTIINDVLIFLGVIFLILTIYGGFLWMTAGGNEETLKKAKKWIINAVIGLIIVLAAYSITSFVVGQIISSTTK